MGSPESGSLESLERLFDDSVNAEIGRISEEEDSLHSMSRDMRDYFRFTMPDNHPDLVATIAALKQLGARDRETLFQMLRVLRSRFRQDRMPSPDEVFGYVRDMGRTL